MKPFVTPELFARGVRVTQAMPRPVAEVDLTFTLALLHQVPRFDHALHSGLGWSECEAAPPRNEILGSRPGVSGPRGPGGPT